MGIDNLSALVATVLAVSLTSERIVTVVKTAFPHFLSEEVGSGTRALDPLEDRARRLVVQLLAFAASWITAGFIAQGGAGVLGWQPLGHIMVSENQTIPAWVVGVLGSGGSALWNNRLGYSKAVKDVRIQERVSSALDNVGKASELGLPSAASATELASTQPRLPLSELRKRANRYLSRDETLQPEGATL
jgi:hypothetical protein